MIWPCILEARAEIQKYFRSFFGSNENFKICFRDLLTFILLMTNYNTPLSWLQSFVRCCDWLTFLVAPAFQWTGAQKYTRVQRRSFLLLSKKVSGMNWDTHVPWLSHNGTKAFLKLQKSSYLDTRLNSFNLLNRKKIENKVVQLWYFNSNGIS